MDRGIRIAIIGESVLMEGIRINLEDDPAISIQHFGPNKLDATQLISQFKPNIIIYEIGFPAIEEVLADIRQSLGIRLVVVDDHQNQVLVMDSKLFTSPRMADLQQLINFPAGDDYASDLSDTAAGKGVL